MEFPFDLLTDVAATENIVFVRDANQTSIEDGGWVSLG